MSTETPSVRLSQPARLLTWLGIAAIVLGLVVSGILITRMVGDLPSAPTTTINGRIQLDKPGLTLFAGTQNAPQTCTVKDQSGAPVPLGPPPRPEQFDTGSRVYYVLAHSTTELPPQTFAVACTDRTVPYFLGPRHTLDAFVGPLITALGVFTFSTLLGVALLIVAHRSRKRAAATAKGKS